MPPWRIASFNKVSFKQRYGFGCIRNIEHNVFSSSVKCCRSDVVSLFNDNGDHGIGALRTADTALGGLLGAGALGRSLVEVPLVDGGGLTWGMDEMEAADIGAEVGLDTVIWMLFSWPGLRRWGEDRTGVSIGGVALADSL